MPYLYKHPQSIVLFLSVHVGRKWVFLIMKLQKELDELLLKRKKLHEKQMATYRNGSATRARTTTNNAIVSSLNERIISIRNTLKDK